jgi:signal transduction histidine kinase
VIPSLPARGWLDGGLWLFVPLALLTVGPSACVLWFMNEAVTTESDAARQRVVEAYRGQLRLVRSRLDGVWHMQAARLDGDGGAEARFERLIAAGTAEGAVFLNRDGSVAYPDRRGGHAGASADLEQRVASLSQVPPAARAEAVGAIADRLNDYSISLPATARMTLMTRLRAQAPNVWLTTQSALQLSMDFLDAERAAPAPDVVRQTALRDVWALTSADRRVVGLYRTGRIESLMHDFLHEISPAGVVFIAYPPDVAADAEAVAAGPWLPGWQLSFVPLDQKSSPDGAGRRAVYVSVAIVGVALMTLAGAVAFGGLRRHLHLTRLKTDLVAAASHELRTPLAAMRVLVDGLLADANPDPAKVRDYLQLLAMENARLSRLIANFLTFSRLDRHQYRFALEPVAPSAIVSSAVDAVRERLPSTCELRVDVEEPLPAVRADADALPTALVNLLDNALKYTPEQKCLGIRAYRDGDRFVAFAVTDNGIGIARGERRRIFRRFYRVDRRLSRDTGGVGLGLSIVELIVRGHRGRVDVTSEAGHGSTFVIRLPAVPGVHAT